MELNFTDEENAFRDEVRAFLEENLPQEVSDKIKAGNGLSKEEFDNWHAALNARGWLANNWPKEFGGTEWNAVQRHIFEEECALAHAPRIVPFGLSMLGPVLQKFGSKEQQDHFLPRILNGEHWWCQRLFGARGRVGSGIAQDTGGARGRSLCGQWPENLDNAGTVRELDFLSGAD